MSQAKSVGKTWEPEDELESSLKIFFDSTAEDNLNIESIYALGTGLVMNRSKDES